MPLPEDVRWAVRLLPIDPFAPTFRTVVNLAAATLLATFLAAALLTTPFLPKLLLAARFCARRFAPALSFAVQCRLPARFGAFVAFFFLRRTVLSAGLGSVTTVRPRNLRSGSTMSIETGDSVKPVPGFAGVLSAGICRLLVGTAALVSFMTLRARAGDAAGGGLIVLRLFVEAERLLDLPR
jgi:hypothetical protein